MPGPPSRGERGVLLVAVAGLLGLAVGSFLNVVIHRVPRGESVVHPPSRCPACGKQIRARHNVPVLGWLLLRGKCADCGSRISIRYPLIELGTGVLFALLAWRLGDLPAALPAFLWFAGIAVALAFIDIEERGLPDVIVLPSYVVLAVLLTAAALWEREASPLGRAAIDAGALFGLRAALAPAPAARPGRRR